MTTFCTKTLKRIILGTWSLGGEGFGKVTETDAISTLQYAYENGIRSYDTAPIYAHGQSEIRLQKALGQHRNAIQITTKVGMEWRNNTVIHDAGTAAIRGQLESSLLRLKTDYIDTAILHWPDPNTPIFDCISTLKTLKKKGKIRHWGLGNLSQDQIKTLEHHDPKPCIQLPVNPIYPNAKLCEMATEKCQIVAYGLFLQGAILSENPTQYLAQLGKRDQRHRNPALQSLSDHQNWLSDFHKSCQETDTSPANRILKWALEQADISQVIIGAKTKEQLKNTLFSE